MVRKTASASVVIACFTQRRWHQLSAAIDSVLAQTTAAEEVILVVDHNEELYQRAGGHWPSVRVLRNEFAQGASGARNTGAFMVTSPFVAFLDDDAVADPRWLERLLAEFADPAVIGVGGVVEAAWDGPRPPWFPDEFAWVVGASYPGMPVAVAETRNVWAENMAVRRDRFMEVDGFRMNFGKVGTHSSPEDTDLCLRMAANGGHWLYVPDARIAHHVPPDRSSFRYFLRRSFHEGEGKAALSALSPAGALSSERDYSKRVLPQAVSRGLYQAVLQRRLLPATRAAAIVVGFLAAGAGYTKERIIRAR